MPTSGPREQLSRDLSDLWQQLPSGFRIPLITLWELVDSWYRSEETSRKNEKKLTTGEELIPQSRFKSWNIAFNLTKNWRWVYLFSRNWRSSWSFSWRHKKHSISRIQTVKFNWPGRSTAWKQHKKLRQKHWRIGKFTHTHTRPDLLCEQRFSFVFFPPESGITLCQREREREYRQKTSCIWNNGSLW